jgi:hypothetical protein
MLTRMGAPGRCTSKERSKAKKTGLEEAYLGAERRDIRRPDARERVYHLTAPSKPLAITFHPALQQEPVRSTINVQARSIAAQGSFSKPVSMYLTLIKIENPQLNPSWLPLSYAQAD